ncbi:hypothetical protein C8J57DRAFT_1304179 [Mycena rebaudengoi]|nr:hypothetical protein C8J57DRAFT_1304179 [Mycena rebaudengoi]
MSASQNDNDSILGLDRGVDDRSSASSSSSVGVDNAPAQGPSRTSQLYQTPDARSHTSSIGQRVKDKLTELSGGRICILTKESTPQVSIEAAHLVARATPGKLLAQLEFSFGLKYRQLHIDTTGNLVYIRVDLHRSFDHMGWFLLPESHVIKRVQEYKPGTQNYKQVFTETEFTYRIIPMQLFCDRTAVFQRVSVDSEEHNQIFPAEPSSPLTVKSHVNPFFVIANAGAKIAANISLLPPGWESNMDILKIVGIWLRWTSVKPSPEWLKHPRSRPRGNDRHGAGDGRGSQPRSRRDRDSPTPRSSRSAHFAATGGTGAGASLSGNTFVRDLPELDRDDSSHTTDSNILTSDAVHTVGFLDRTEFFEKWLRGVGCSTVSAETRANRTEVYEMYS